MNYLTAPIAAVLVALTCVAAHANDRGSLVDIGRNLYQHGQLPDQTGDRPTPKARVDIGSPPISVPLALFPCRNCHGATASGAKEAGVSAPNIRWRELRKPYRLVTDSGRERPPYDLARLFRALTMGIDAAGAPLSAAMPRYHFDRQQVAAIAAYLAVIGSPSESGIDDHVLRIGLLRDGRRTTDDDAARMAVSVFFEQINADGGIFNRRIELFSGDIGALTGARLFAAITADADGGAMLLQARERNGHPPIPVISVFGPSGSMPMSPAPPRLFQLYPGTARRAAALIKFAGAELGLRPDQVQTHPAPTTARAILISRAVDLSQLPHTQGSGPTLLVACPLSPDLRDLLAAYPGPVYVTTTPGPSDTDRHGQQRYLRLTTGAQLPRRDLQRQLWYLAAAELIRTTLSNSGRALTTQAFTAALSSPPSITTGWGPSLSFAAGRRTGATHIAVVPLYQGPHRR